MIKKILCSVSLLAAIAVISKNPYAGEKDIAVFSYSPPWEALFQYFAQESQELSRRSEIALLEVKKKLQGVEIGKEYSGNLETDKCLVVGTSDLERYAAFREKESLPPLVVKLEEMSLEAILSMKSYSFTQPNIYAYLWEPHLINKQLEQISHLPQLKESLKKLAPGSSSLPSGIENDLQKIFTYLDKQHQDYRQYRRISGELERLQANYRCCIQENKTHIEPKKESDLDIKYGWQWLTLLRGSPEYLASIKNVTFSPNYLEKESAEIFFRTIIHGKNIEKLTLQVYWGNDSQSYTTIMSNLQELKQLKSLTIDFWSDQETIIPFVWDFIAQAIQTKQKDFLDNKSHWTVKTSNQKKKIACEIRKTNVHISTSIQYFDLIQILKKINILHTVNQLSFYWCRNSITPYYFSNFMKSWEIHKNLEEMRFFIDMQDKPKSMNFMMKFEDGQLRSSNLPDLRNFPGASIKRSFNVIQTLKPILIDAYKETDLEQDSDGSNALARHDLATNNFTFKDLAELNRKAHDIKSFFDTVRRYYRARNQITLALQPLAQDIQKLNEKLIQENPQATLMRKEVLSDILNDFLRPKKIEPAKIHPGGLL
jgi:hypothetical protein